MLDLKWLREQPEALDRALARRGLPPMAAALLERDTAVRALHTELQEQQARRNALSKEVGRLRAQGGDAGSVIAEVAALKDRLQYVEERLRERSADLDAVLAGIPNILAEDVPDGPDESANRLVRSWVSRPCSTSSRRSTTSSAPASAWISPAPPSSRAPVSWC